MAAAAESRLNVLVREKRRSRSVDSRTGLGIRSSASRITHNFIRYTRCSNSQPHPIVKKKGGNSQGTSRRSHQITQKMATTEKDYYQQKSLLASA